MNCFSRWRYRPTKAKVKVIGLVCSVALGGSGIDDVLMNEGAVPEGQRIATQFIQCLFRSIHGGYNVAWDCGSCRRWAPCAILEARSLCKESS